MSHTSDFLDAFSAAIHDVQLEELGFKIYHFFDSDFLHRLIFGYRDGRTRELLLANSRAEESTASQQLLMGALVAQRMALQN